MLEFPDSLRDLDQLVTRAVRRGVRPLLILDYGNPIYDGGGQISSPEAIEAWSRYVRFVVAHFKGRVDQFEVWNEWNIGGGGTSAQRRALRKSRGLREGAAGAYGAVKAGERLGHRDWAVLSRGTTISGSRPSRARVGSARWMASRRIRTCLQRAGRARRIQRCVTSMS